VVILFIQKTSKSNGSYRKLRDVLLLSLIFFILISQSSIIVITKEQSTENPNEPIVNNDLKDFINFFCFIRIDQCVQYHHQLPKTLWKLYEFLNDKGMIYLPNSIAILSHIFLRIGMMSPIIFHHMLTFVGFNSKSVTVHTYGLFGYRALHRQTNLYPTAYLIGFTGFRQINYSNGAISMIGWALCCYVK
jgi:hypothetical protein